MVLHDHSYAEHTTGNQWNEKVEEHLARTFVKDKSQLIFFRLDSGKNEYCQQGDDEKNHAN